MAVRPGLCQTWLETQIVHAQAVLTQYHKTFMQQNFGSVKDLFPFLSFVAYLFENAEDKLWMDEEGAGAGGEGARGESTNNDCYHFNIY